MKLYLPEIIDFTSLQPIEIIYSIMEFIACVKSFADSNRFLGSCLICCFVFSNRVLWLALWSNITQKIKMINLKFIFLVKLRCLTECQCRLWIVHIELNLKICTHTDLFIWIVLILESGGFYSCKYDFQSLQINGWEWE